MMLKNCLAVGLGEVLFDVMGGEAHLGGAPANFVWHCHELGLEAAAVSAVGQDGLGMKALALLREASLARGVETVSHPTGRVDVTLDARGNASYVFLQDTAYDHVPMSPRQLELAKSCDIVCFGTLAQRGAAGRLAVERFLEAVSPACLRIFDVNLRQNFFSAEVIEASLSRCDLLKLNEDELKVLPNLLRLPPDPEALFLELRTRFGIRGLALTLGADGSRVFWNDEVSFLESPRVEVADTVGAGDSFTAALASSLMSGMDLARSHRRAVAVASYVCTQRGAMVHLPASVTNA